MSTIFISHSQRDKVLPDFFDVVFAREPTTAIRFPFEFSAQVDNPTITLVTLLTSSVALFVMLSPEIQTTGTLHTGNWISTEVGIAKGRGIPIWVFELVSEPVDFPVPYVDHYIRLALHGEYSDSNHQWLRAIVNVYTRALSPDYGAPTRLIWGMWVYTTDRPKSGHSCPAPGAWQDQVAVAELVPEVAFGNRILV